MKTKAKIKTIQQIPDFNNEDDERNFWATHDSIDYFDFSHPIQMDFPHLRPSTNSMTIRLPSGMLADLRTLANKRDVPYQSLLKVFLAERLEKELRPALT